MLVFAYDGSLNGDWIAHYAVRFAHAADDHRLRLLHVHERAVADELAGRLARIAAECRRLDVVLDTVVEAAAGRDVATRLLELLPSAPDTQLVAGTRAQPRDLCYLADTVAATLLARAPCAVVALHVVHPAMLGQPDSLLLPFRRDATVPLAVLPLLRLLAPALREVHVLVVEEIARLRYRLIGTRGARRRIELARARAQAIEGELLDALGPVAWRSDAGATLSDDIARETLAWAARLRARLVALDASHLPARLAYGDPLEQLLRDASCDVALYRAPR